MPCNTTDPGYYVFHPTHPHFIPSLYVCVFLKNGRFFFFYYWERKWIRVWVQTGVSESVGGWCHNIIPSRKLIFLFMIIPLFDADFQRGRKEGLMHNVDGWPGGMLELDSFWGWVVGGEDNFLKVRQEGFGCKFYHLDSNDAVPVEMECGIVSKESKGFDSCNFELLTTGIFNGEYGIFVVYLVLGRCVGRTERSWDWF